MSLKDKTVIEITTQNPLNNKYYYTDLILPATAGEIEDCMQRARIMNAPDSWKDIFVLSCPYLPELTDTRLDCPTIDELNFFAKRLQNLCESELYALSGVFIHEKELGKFDDGLTMKHLINLTYGLDGVAVVCGIKSDQELGEFVIDNELEEFISKMPDDGIPYLDRCEIGKNHRESEDGIYVDGRYIATATYSFPEVYDGIHIPKDETLEYGSGVFLLKIASQPHSDEEARASEPQSVWISLPIAEEKANGAAESIGAPSIAECVCSDFKTALPGISGELFQDMKNFDLLNKTAAQYDAMNEFDRIKYKAMLQKEEPETLQRAFELSKDTAEYDLSHYCDSKESFSEVYLMYHLPTDFDREYLDGLPLEQFGGRVLTSLHASTTDYGVVSERGGDLMALVPYWNRTEMSESNNQEIGGIEM